MSRSHIDAFKKYMEKSSGPIRRRISVSLSPHHFEANVGELYPDGIPVYLIGMTPEDELKATGLMDAGPQQLVWLSTFQGLAGIGGGDGNGYEFDSEEKKSFWESLNTLGRGYLSIAYNASVFGIDDKRIEDLGKLITGILSQFSTPASSVSTTDE